MRKLLLLGRNGQIGREIEHRSAGPGLTALGRQDLDLTDISSLRHLIRDLRPSIVINAAAYTAVDHAETERDLAHTLNATVPEVLAVECKQLDALLVHFSTDYVFDGLKASPYTQDDATAPLNHYGRTKLDGELGVRESGAQHLILRTSWVFSEHGTNFVKTMLRLARERDEIRVVADQQGCPTASADLAACALTAAIQARECPHKQGTYHATCSGPTTWADFAETIFARAAALGLLDKVPHISRINTSDYPTAAKRPLYSVLSNSKLHHDLGIALPSWREGLDSVLQRLDTSSQSPDRRPHCTTHS